MKEEVIRFCYHRKMATVTECELAYTHKADVLALRWPACKAFIGTKHTFLYEIEVKCDASDLRKDLTKPKWHRFLENPPVTHFWYAVPSTLEKQVLEVAEALRGRNVECGILLVEEPFRSRVLREPKRLIKEASDRSVNAFLHRSQWELFNMRQIVTESQVEKRKNVISPDSIWKRINDWNGAKVRVINASEDSVEYIGTISNRKGTCSTHNFVRRFRPT